MERNVWKQGFAPAAGAVDATAFSGMTYQERVQRQFKRTNLRFKIPLKPYLDRHVLSNINNVELELGALYEINHKLVASKSPNQLKFIRVAMVTEKNELNTEVKFPSMLALREYLSGGNTSMANYPHLDEQFVMEAKLAKEILYRKIPIDEFQQQKRLPRFWVVSSKISELSNLIIRDRNTKDDSLVKGLHSTISGSLLEKVLKDDGLLNYKVHKRIKVIMARNGSKSPRVSSSSSSDRTQNSTDREAKRKKRKRKLVMQTNLSKGEKKKPSSKTNGQNLNKLSDDRLSRSERYKNADEVKMLEIMKEKEAKASSHTSPPPPPPPGWKPRPGDSFSQDSETCVIEQIASIKKNVQEIQLVKIDDEAGDKANLPFTRFCSESDNKLNSSQQEEEDYERLMKRKAELEQELLQISQSLKGLQLKFGTDKGAELEEKANNSGNDKKAGMNEGKKKAERLGIFKPQATFPLPGSGSAGNNSRTNVLSHHPTPTSDNTSAQRFSSNSTQSSCDQGDKAAHSSQLDVDAMGFSMDTIKEIRRLPRMYFRRAWLDRLKEQVHKQSNS